MASAAEVLEGYGRYQRLLEFGEGRRELTKLDPLLFALLYLPHHLRSEATGGEITFSEFHLDLIEYAKTWTQPLGKMKQYRDAFIAPRESGKSTWLFLLLPLWAAAHGHVKFISAFSDSATQAEQHLASIKRELQTNEMLQADFPSLCEPARGGNVARYLADNRGQIQQANGFVMRANGIDSSVAGMKVGALRPDVLILDDVEPGEAMYSAHLVSKRLATIQDVIMPLNAFARVLITGTVTMSGSIVHQLVQAARGGQAPAEWIKEENITPRYFPAILQDDDGVERSLWPEKWPIAELQAMRHTRTYLKNFANDPVDADGAYWTPADIQYLQLEAYGKTILSIDPAVTTAKTSDWTGLAVVSKDPSEPKLFVRHANHVRLSPGDLRKHVLILLERFEEITTIVLETNQGMDLWNQVFGGIPVKLVTVHQKLQKEVRAQRTLVYYERGRVFHTERFPILEDEMLSFPNSLHDDTVDAVVTGIHYFAENARKKSAPSQQISYV